MTPVLIYTDTKSINDENSTLNNVVPIYQAVYNALVACGVTNITLAEIDALVNNARRQNNTPFVYNYVQSKLVAAVSPYVVNGVTWPYASVAAIITVPDISGITAALQPVWGGNSQSIFIGNAKGTRLNLLQIVTGVISAVATASTQITALYSFYTANDASVTLVNQLQAVCDALNTFNAANGGIYIKRIQTVNRNQFGDLEAEIPGIAISQANNNFIVSLYTVRKFEQIGTMNFA